MEFRLLGSVQATVDGATVPLGRRRERCLLGLLLLDVGTAVSVGRLSGLLWDDDAPARPRAALQTYVSRLRAALAAAGAERHGVRLRTTDGGYLVEADRRSIDVHEFRRLFEQARNTAALAERHRLLDEALTLWRGAPLADVASDKLRQRVGVGLEELHLTAVELRASAALALGRHDDVIPELTGLVADHPTRERLLAALMLALHRAGRQGDALAAYERGRRRLVDELGLDPGGELRALHAAILRGDPDPVPPAVVGRRTPTVVQERAAWAGSGLSGPDSGRTAAEPSGGAAGDPTDEPAGAARAAGRPPAEGGSGFGALSGRPAADPTTARAAAPQAGMDGEDGRRGRVEDGDAGWPVPAQLPADTVGFTGRAGYLSELDALLDGFAGDADPTAGPAAQPAAGTPARTVALVGAGGVGKTALAVHWAHRNAHRFPDGQLFANLRGYAPLPATVPYEILARFLRALGVPHDQVPADPDEQAALYRTLLANRRVLVVLDNARDADHVRPLLPGSPTCLTVVTSRNRLGGLVAREGAARLALDVLDPAEARALLARLLGTERAAREADAVDELARLCGYLPLALRIAAANLAAGSGQTVAGYVAQLRAGDRLAALSADDDDAAAVRATFDLSYQRLAESDRRLFRLVGLRPGYDVTAPSTAALAGVTVAEAQAGLDRLTAAHLCVEHTPGRYTLHDLLCLYACERAVLEETPEAGAAALGRLLDWYLAGADAAARQLYPHLLRLPVEPPVDAPTAPVFADPVAALSFLDDERGNLVAAVRHAADEGPRRVAWLLADTLRGYFYLRRHATEWQTTAGAALRASRQAGDQHGEASARLSLGQAHWSAGRYVLALGEYEEAAAACRRCGWRRGEAAALGNLGNLYRTLGQVDTATGYLVRALAHAERLGWTDGTRATFNNLGVAHYEAGRLTQAVDCYRRALALCDGAGPEPIRANVLNLLGNACHQLGRLDEALHHLSEATEAHRRFGNQHGLAGSMDTAAAVHHDAGRGEQALALAEQALALARDVGDLDTQADALNTLGAVYSGLGDHDRAADLHTRALAMSRQFGCRYAETSSLLGLAEAERDRGDLDRALARTGEALDLARTCRYRVLEGRALTVLATVHLGLDRPAEAADGCRKALALHEAAGHRLGVARALLALGHAVRHVDAAAAARHWTRALDIFTGAGAAAEADRVRTLVATVRS